MPELGEIGTKTEIPGLGARIETQVRNDQKDPFHAQKEGSSWMLSINRDHFLSKGFTPDEVDGATYLEEERLLAQTSVDSVSELRGLKHWQEAGRGNPRADAFKTLFERISALQSLEKTDQTKAESAKRYLKKIAPRAPSQEYPDQLLQGLLHKAVAQEDSLPSSELVSNVLANLAREEHIEERSVSALEALSSPTLSYEAKKRLQETPSETPEAEQEESEEQGEQTPPTPPEAQDEYEQHRGKESKGKGEPMFTIDPYYGGYWETESYDSIDETGGKLKKSEVQAQKTVVSPTQESGEPVCTIRGSSGTNLFSLPLSLNLTPDRESIAQLQTAGMEILEDSEGHIFIKSPSNQPYEIALTRTVDGVQSDTSPQDNSTAETTLPNEITEKIKEIQELQGDSVEKATLWQEFVQSHFTYPKDEEVEAMYARVDSLAGSRLSTMTQGKLLDCYLAREFFLAGLKRLGLPDLEWKAVNGHYLAGRQKDGTGHLQSGTGHAWVRARVKGSDEWMIFDPTPKGDPAKQQEGSSEEFGESSSQLISGEDMQELEDEITGGSDQPKDLDHQEKYLMEFADEAGISPDEARKILDALRQVDELKDKNGRNILKRVKEEFDHIIQAYTKERVENLGNVEMSRGRDLEDPVAAYLDMQTGSLDPHGFTKQAITEEQEELYGGFDLEVIADGSGSMDQSVGNIVKYIAQQKMSYLLHRGAHYFAQEAQKRRLRLVTPLAVRSSQYIFRGNNIEEIKPLTAEFTPPQMAELWKKSAENIGGGTPAHLGLQAVLDNIPEEEVELLRNKKLLKVVALISDGGYDNHQEVDRLRSALEEMNVIVAEFRISDARSLEDLPENVAEKVVEAARKLMPEKVKK